MGSPLRKPGRSGEDCASPPPFDTFAGGGEYWGSVRVQYIDSCNRRDRRRVLIMHLGDGSMLKHLLAPTFVLALAGLAQAQAGGGFGRGDLRERIPWYASIDKVGNGDNLTPMERRRLKAMGVEPSEKKYIFIYIRPLSEDKEPNEFNTCQD